MIDQSAFPISVVRYPRPGTEGAQGLRLRWSTGVETFLNGETLRRNCPCATCNELRGKSEHDKPLTPKRSSALRVVQSSADEETRLEQVWPVGKYAIGIRWADKHDSGIYSFDVLREIANQTTDDPNRT